jgi:hypothetical protein
VNVVTITPPWATLEHCALVHQAVKRISHLTDCGHRT